MRTTIRLQRMEPLGLEAKSEDSSLFVNYAFFHRKFAWTDSADGLHYPDGLSARAIAVITMVLKIVRTGLGQHAYNRSQPHPPLLLGPLYIDIKHV